MKKISRTLATKAISYTIQKRRKADYKHWSPTRIDDLIREIIKESPSIADRHYPNIEGIKEGRQCSFINKVKDYEKDGILFHVCSYTNGLIPETIEKNFSKPEVDLEAINMQKADSKKELVFHYRCIALGQVLIIESVSGSGGSAMLKKLLNYLAKKHIDKHHPRIELNDFVSNELRKLIQSKGGISSIKARAVMQGITGNSIFGKKLSDVGKSVQGTNKCMVTWESDKADELDIDTSIQMFEEAQSSGLEGVTLNFKKGGSIGDLSNYTEKKPIEVQRLNSGLPATNEIEKELTSYLGELRSPRNESPVNTDGSVKQVEFITVAT